MEATVTKLPLDRTAESGKVYNYELTYNLEKTAQGRFLTDFPQSIGVAELNERLDVLARAAKRQQLLAEIDVLARELEECEEREEKWRFQHEEAERAHRRERDRLDGKRKLAEMGVERRIESAANEHRRQGKRSDFELDKAAAGARSAIKGAEAEVRAVDEEIRKREEERQTALDTLDTNLRGSARQRQALAAKIEKKRTAARELG